MTPAPWDWSSSSDRDIERLRAAARRRLEARAGLASDAPVHFRRPAERPFTVDERERVTILFGGLTQKHERLIEAVFASCGYTARPLPQTDLAACHLGKQYCNNGLCNPAYFTIGNLVRHLQQLEASGVSRQEIVDRHVFFTAGSCGPCRFGMYEAEYRLALRNAGFDDFRVLLFQQNHGVRADTGEPGLKLTLHLGLGAVDAFAFGDALQAFGYETRPYETTPGLTDRRLAESLEIVAASIEARRPADAAARAPAFLRRRYEQGRLAPFLRAWDHLYGRPKRDVIDRCRVPLDDVEVDRLRVKPVVKITGEFWAQTTESDGNFGMFGFLEREGAHVLVEPLGGWILYLLHSMRARLPLRRGGGGAPDGPLVERVRQRLRDDRWLAGRWLLLEVGERLYRHLYDRVRRSLGVVHGLVDQRELARLAEPHYRYLARGGEGHLEVGKSIYYTVRNAAHMVISLKPFGCMPSTQSDGVQAALQARYRDMLFIPVETGAEGELAAHSRVQMALVEARVRAQQEFDRALASTGRSLEEIREFVGGHPYLRRATYRVPHRPGVAGVAAGFVLHVGDLMRSPALRVRRAAARPVTTGGAS
jgi:predicted nucleotide-binding protein (sugar kinase/HSP70/actin superfamily)